MTRVLHLAMTVAMLTALACGAARPCKAPRCDQPQARALACACGKPLCSACLVDAADDTGRPSSGRYVLDCNAGDGTGWPECEP